MKAKDFLIFGLIAAAALLAYRLFMRRSGSSAAASLPTTDAADDAAFKAIYDKLAAKVGPGSMTWILQNVKSLMTSGVDNSGTPYPGSNLINGQRKKTGALIDVYARGVAAWADNGQFNQQLHDELYNIWYNYSSNAQLSLI